MLSFACAVSVFFFPRQKGVENMLLIGQDADKVHATRRQVGTVRRMMTEETSALKLDGFLRKMSYNKVGNNCKVQLWRGR